MEINEDYKSSPHSTKTKDEMRNLKREIEEKKRIGSEYGYAKDYSTQKEGKYKEKITKLKEKGKSAEKIQKMMKKKETQEQITKILSEAHDKKLKDIKNMVEEYNKNVDNKKDRMNIKVRSKGPGDSYKLDEISENGTIALGTLFGIPFGTVTGFIAGVANPILGVGVGALTGLSVGLGIASSASSKGRGRDKENLARRFMTEEDKKFKPDKSAKNFDKFIEKTEEARRAALVEGHY